MLLIYMSEFVKNIDAPTVISNGVLLLGTYTYIYDLITKCIEDIINTHHCNVLSLILKKVFIINANLFVLT